MSDSDDDIFGTPDSGGLDGEGAPEKRPRRRQSAPRYKEDSASDDSDAAEASEGAEASEEEDVVRAAPPRKKRPIKSVRKGVKKEDSDEEASEEEDVVAKAASPRKRRPGSARKAVKKEEPTTSDAYAHAGDAVDEMTADDATSSADVNPPTNTSAQPQSAGLEVVIPHALLAKHQGSGRNECTLLVQVESNDEQSHHLDFHGQSGAIGRFEADGEGVILDLKGYQYRGTIRPGPTAMVVALTRDGQLKVEAITDEFVSLDASTKTDVMAKLDAVVGGDLDASYQYQEENVNAHRKKGKGEGDGDAGGGGGGKRGPPAKGGGGAPKKRKTAKK